MASYAHDRHVTMAKAEEEEEEGRKNETKDESLHGRRRRSAKYHNIFTITEQSHAQVISAQSVANYTQLEVGDKPCVGGI